MSTSPSHGSDLDDELVTENSEWHDDYFTTAEWKQVADLVAKEGERMIARGTCVDRPASYSWLHTNKILGTFTILHCEFLTVAAQRDSSLKS